MSDLTLPRSASGLAQSAGRAQGAGPAQGAGLAGGAGGASGMTEALTMIGRCLRLSRRNLEALITSLALPVIILLLFVYLFGGAISTGGSYVTYVVPGVILLAATFGAGTTAVSVSQDMSTAVIDRFRSMGIRGASVLSGQVAASVARNLVSAVLVFGVAFAIGFRPHAGPLAWLGTAGVLAIFVLAISWLAAALGLLANSPEAASGFSFLVTFLPYASSAFVPIATMPGWLQCFSRNQPVTPVIETVRGLLLGAPVANHAWAAMAWCAGITVVGVALCAVLFRRRAT
jgi:ABC-2 type transport system permease protein